MKCLELLERLNHNLAIFLVLVFTVCNSFGFVEVNLKKFTKVKGDTVYLKDIAVIKAEGEEPSFINFLKNLPVLKSPKPSTTISVSKNQLVFLLQKNHLALDSFKFSGSENCIITRDYKKLSTKKIEEKVRKFINQKFEKVEIVSVNLTNKTYLIPSTSISEKIKIKSESLKNLYLEYQIYENGNLTYKIPVTVSIKKYMKVVSAKRDIPKGKIITLEDLKTTEIEFKRRSNYITEIENAVGKVAKRDILKGTVIKTSLLKPDYKVKRRKNVKIIYRNGNINIELMGLALENGAVGDIVKIKNISSGKVILCKVIKENTVIYLGSSF